MAYLVLFPWCLLDPLGEVWLTTHPVVAEVRVLREGTPVHRIIHILDWHHVPKDWFILDIEQTRGVKLTDEQAEKEFADFLDEVDRIQLDQMVLLRYLKRCGIREVFSEGLTHEREKECRELIEVIRETTPYLEQSFREAPDRETRALFQVLLMSDRETILNLGSPGRLLLKREFKVLPLEDAKAHAGAKPVKDGKIVLDPEKIQARRDAIVRNCLTRKTAIIVLGSSHDLSESLRRIQKNKLRVHSGSCEKLRGLITGGGRSDRRT